MLKLYVFKFLDKQTGESCFDVDIIATDKADALKKAKKKAISLLQTVGASVNLDFYNIKLLKMKDF
jgi:hypothetical protein